MDGISFRELDIFKKALVMMDGRWTEDRWKLDGF